MARGFIPGLDDLSVPQDVRMSDDAEHQKQWKRAAALISEGICPICLGQLHPGVVDDEECGVCSECACGWRLHQYDGEGGHPLWTKGEMLVEQRRELPERFRRPFDA